ncbi:UNVERIFIED_CONTAM: hypothetical protein Sradi_2075100 [Sesamum radiatum]|uniref:Uncharacterized protein n=1 Tax=Sesamum radiatum TaxID=300843 RepID=A0AAW2TJK8_SESRA
MEELSPALLRAIQHVVAAALREHAPVAAPPRVAPLPEVDALDEEDEGEIPVPVHQQAEGVTSLYLSPRNPFASLHRRNKVSSLRHHIRWGSTALVQSIARSVIGSFQEFRSLFLHQFANSRKVPAATQEVKANAFYQGLLDDFFKSLAKKPVSKFDALLARAAKYINMEKAQAAKKDSRGEKRKEIREEALSKKPRGDLRDRKPPFQRSWRDTPERPKSDKLCRLHNDYGYTTEERRHLKNEIERLIQNEYLQEHVCWEKARGTVPYQKKEGDKAREVRAPSPGRPSREGAKQTIGARRTTIIPRKGVIRMIAGGPARGDSHQARKSQVREAHQISVKEVLDIEAVEDALVIRFRRAERSGPQTIHNDALVIKATKTNYEVGRIFIDSGSSADILFGEAYNQIQLGDVSLEKVNTSLYGFAGEVVHPRSMISLPLMMGTGTMRKTCLLKFLMVDVPSAYNVILGNPEKTTRIGSHLGEEARKEITLCLRCNADIFAWTLQDLEGIDP